MSLTSLEVATQAWWELKTELCEARSWHTLSTMEDQSTCQQSFARDERSRLKRTYTARVVAFELVHAHSNPQPLSTFGQRGGG